MFRDRREAGRRLLAALAPLAPPRPVIVALPRGGLPVAAILASGLEAPLELAIVRKIGAPGQRELAVGAVSGGPAPQYEINAGIAAMLGLSAEDVRRLAGPELETIRRRQALYYGGREPLPLAGMTAIVTDDGIATGATMKIAIRAVRLQEPKSVWVAVPVAPADTIAELEGLADRVVCLETPEPFMAVGAHYAQFDQVSDEEVVAIMRDHAEARGKTG